MHCGYVIKVENLRPHSNADRLQVLTVFGNDTCVGLDVKVGDIGIYFPTDLQLSVEYANANNLVRKKDDAGNNVGGYMDPSKRNVKTIRLRGEISDGIYMNLNSLAFTGVDLSTLKIGDIIDVVNGVEICKKYIPRSNHRRGSAAGGNRTRKKKVPIAPLFMEHADTEQLAYNLSAFKPGDEIEITLKMHGTSGRTARLPVLKGYRRTIWDRLFRREGTPIYEGGYVSGTRRVVLEDYEGGFYGDNHFREKHSKFFEGKLQAGETVYYEIIGFTDSGAPIMGDGKNSKVGPDFVKQYGETTTFSYGCSPDGNKIMYGIDEDGPFQIPVDATQSDIYVYRMTMTNEDGFVVEYTPDFMRYRCEQMGVKYVPVFEKFIIPEGHPDYATAGDWVMAQAEKYYDGPDPIGKTHIREGVVVRIINRPKFCAYKHKNTAFKILEGIIKESAAAPDMEEAQEIMEETK